MARRPQVGAGNYSITFRAPETFRNGSGLRPRDSPEPFPSPKISS
jgi:hypothetical protein